MTAAAASDDDDAQPPASTNTEVNASISPLRLTPRPSAQDQNNAEPVTKRQDKTRQELVTT